MTDEEVKNKVLEALEVMQEKLSEIDKTEYAVEIVYKADLYFQIFINSLACDKHGECWYCSRNDECPLELRESCDANNACMFFYNEEEEL